MAKKTKHGRLWQKAQDVELAHTGAANPEKEQPWGGAALLQKKLSWRRATDQQVAFGSSDADGAAFPTMAESLAKKAVPDKTADRVDDLARPTVAESLEEGMPVEDEGQPAPSENLTKEGRADDIADEGHPTAAACLQEGLLAEDKGHPATAESLKEDDNLDGEGVTALAASTEKFTAVVDPGRYSHKLKIGKGAYGAVVRAYDNVTETWVAIKSHHGSLFDDLLLARRNLRELAILSRLNHPNIVRIHDVYVEKDWESFDDVCIVMDVLDGDLRNLLADGSIELSKKHIQWLLYQLLRALAYLHSAGIYHRDLKPSNCLFNQDCTLKICDFGLAAPILEEVFEEPPTLDGEALPPPPRLERKLTVHVVTREYRAPEICLLQKQYNGKVDVWSAACIFAELLQILPGTDSSCRSPLFGGSCCYPLSPDKNARRYGRGEQTEQMQVIIGLLGLPAEEDLQDFGYFYKREVHQYMKTDFKSCEKKTPDQRRSALKPRVPGADFAALDLLEKMLKFGPSLRMTVQEAMSHAFLAPVRDEGSERLAPQRVTLAFEGEEELCLKSDDEDEEANPPKLSVRHCFQKEILHFKSLGS